MACNISAASEMRQYEHYLEHVRRYEDLWLAS
jgi:hypothetical protein